MCSNEDLIDKAEKLPCGQWSEISNLIQRTDDKATQDRLAKIQLSKYHKEEFVINNL